MLSKNFNRKIGLIVILICLTVSSVYAAVGTNVGTNTGWIEQWGITWTFDKPLSATGSAGTYHYGQFVNGDYWVKGPVNIINISPGVMIGNGTTVFEGWTVPNGWTINGSMINPRANSVGQGYSYNAWPVFDASGVPQVEYDYIRYKDSLNVGIGITAQHPLVIPVNSSLISTKSRSRTAPGSVEGSDSDVKTAAILTVVESTPPASSFRPAYCGTQKKFYTADDLHRQLLKELIPPDGTPTLTSIEAKFQKPWVCQSKAWAGKYTFPSDSIAVNYGREIHRDIGIGALMLHLDHTTAQEKTGLTAQQITELNNNKKEKLLRYYVQLGIDLYGIIKDGGITHWHEGGGHGGGRKWPILFAGIMLDNADLKSVGAKSGDYLYSVNPAGGNYGPGGGLGCPQLPNFPPPDYIHFGEDGQTFYVTQLEIDLTNRTGPYGNVWGPDSRDIAFIPYTYTDIGLPEWGVEHSIRPHAVNKHYSAAYRDVAGMSFAGTALAALIMTDFNENGTAISGAKLLWNHNAYFDYTDRFIYSVINPTGEWNGRMSVFSSAFLGSMWYMYRTNYGPVWPNTSTTYTLSISATNGLGAKSPDKTSYNSGETVTLTATPNSGYSFTGWSGNASGTTNPVTITMNANKSVIAGFSAATTSYTLTTTAVNGSIAKSPNKTTYTPGETVTLSATANTGYSFSGWSGDTTGTSNPITVTMNANKTITANFAQDIAGLLNSTTVSQLTERTFSVANDYQTISTSGWNLSNMTITLWAKPVNISGVQYLFGHNVGVWTNTIQLYLNNGSLCLGLEGDHNRQLNIAAFQTNQWYFVSLSWNSNGYTIQVDNQIKGTGTYPSLTQLNTFADIGNDGNSADRTESFSGVIDDVRIYNRALLSTEVTSLYTYGRTTTTPTTPPVIGTQPVNKSAIEGQTASFSVTATGSGTLTYQWQKGVVNIAGATASTYTTPVLALGDNNSTYRCIVTNAGGSTTSTAATLTVTMKAPVIGTQPANRSVTEGQTASFSVTATGSGTLTYQWQKNQANITGATASSYTTLTLAMADNGSTYRCIVTNAGGSTTSTAATLTVTMKAPVITTQPANQSAADRQTASISLTATGSGTLTYQWQKNLVNITGATTSSYTTPTLTMADDGSQYRCIVTNAGGSTTSTAATLTVTPLTMAESMTAHWMLDENTGTTVTDSTSAGRTAALINSPSWGYAWANEDWVSMANQTQAIAIPAAALNRQAGSVAVWVEPDSATGTQFILGHIFNGSNRICLYSVAGKLALGLGSTAILQTNLADLTIGQTVHIALTWSGTSYAVYVNAVLKASGTFEGLTALNTTMDIGNYGDPASRTLGFVGVIEDIRTYCRALTGTEIRDLYYTEDVGQQKPVVFAVQGYSPVTATMPAGAKFNSGTFSWQPWYNQSGDYLIRFTAAGQPDRIMTVSVHDVPLKPWYRQFLVYTEKLE